jgi:hypothetical protein
MKSTALLLWLALAGGDPGSTPSALAGPGAANLSGSAWVGYWLVRGQQQMVSAVLTPVVGREPWAARITFGSRTLEDWVVRREHGHLHLMRTGLGQGRLSATTAGALVGSLTRGEDAGAIELSRRP